ncbi:MAG: hypothetical protein WCB31_02465 [Nitrososphaeraceae archaeon]
MNFLGVITVTTIFVLGNLYENFVQVYSQKQDQEATNLSSIELTGKLVVLPPSQQQ